MLMRFALAARRDRAADRRRASRPRCCSRSRRSRTSSSSEARRWPRAIKDVLDDVDAGRAADDPRARLRPPLVRGDRQGARPAARSDTIILVRLDPRRARRRVMSMPARPEGRRSPATARDKINAAYALGGPKLDRARRSSELPRTSRSTTSSTSTSAASSGAVNRLGCVYIDVDRRYFNDNDPPVGGGGHYADDRRQAGYQKLCGQDALDYVRFRHLDTDLVRAARQQDSCARPRTRSASSKLFRRPQGAAADLRPLHADRHRGTTAILRLLKLASSPRASRAEVQFPRDDDRRGVRDDLRPRTCGATVDAFLEREALDAARAGADATERRASARRQASKRRSSASPRHGVVVANGRPARTTASQLAAEARRSRSTTRRS